MKHPLKSLILALTALSAGIAGAEEAKDNYTLTGTVGLASEYLYRGIAQTNHKPAVQGGFDFGHPSGVYAGVWGSNISWLSDAGAGRVSAPVELDLYGGYKAALGDLSYDVGGLYYYYPGDYPDGWVSPNTFEGYLGLGYKFLSLKTSYAFTNLFGATDPVDPARKAASRGSYYLDLSAIYPLSESLKLIGHVGYQSVEGAKGSDGSTANYTDYKLGATKDALGMSLGLFYSGSNAKGGAGQFYRNAFDKDLGAGRVLFTVSKTL